MNVLLPGNHSISPQNVTQLWIEMSDVSADATMPKRTVNKQTNDAVVTAVTRVECRECSLPTGH